MRILVFSDSHNYDKNMRQALLLNHNRFDCCLHLGDGCREFEALAEEYTGIPFVAVNGNGEDLWGSPRVTETVLDLEGCRIMLTHGHKYNVKFGTDKLIYRAIERECDIVLYGHTHVPENRYEPDMGKGGLYIFNPGSISVPPLNRRPSFGTIDITPKGISLNIAYIQ